MQNKYIQKILILVLKKKSSQTYTIPHYEMVLPYKSQSLL